MKRGVLNILAALVLGLFGWTSAENLKHHECAKEEDEPNSACKHDYKPTCQFYLAPSSIEGAGFGIYTVKDISEKEPYTSSPESPSITVLDLQAQYGEEPNWNHLDYFWGGEGKSAHEALEVSMNTPSFGSLTNYHTLLYNTRVGKEHYVDTMTPRASGSPGMGAYSYYIGSLFYATKNISAGDEIFTNYGEGYLDDRPIGQFIPREEDFAKAVEVVRKVEENMKDMSDDMLQAFRDVAKVMNERVGNILPQTLDEYKALIESIESDDDEALETSIAKSTIISRSIEWIKSEGNCIDNLVSQNSTLPHAGMGAFAQRFIKRGEMIVPAPLLLTTDYESIYEYNLMFDDKKKLRRDPKEEEPVSLHLLTNYCFGHQESSLMFCPQTNGVLINHCSTRRSYGGHCEKYNMNTNPNEKGPNAKIRWAKGWDPDTEDWLELTLKQIEDKVEKRKRGLSFDYVATRDIFPGDEVFIDYGEFWEHEWEYHLSTWEPPAYEDYVPVNDMDKLETLKTFEEARAKPYPDNVQTLCTYWTEDENEIFAKGYKYETKADDWIGDGSHFIYEKYVDSYEWPCVVLERDDERNTYTVKILQEETSGEVTIWHVKNFHRILINYPRESITFATKPYASDQHLNGVFRASAQIPDDMFPPQWKDMN